MGTNIFLGKPPANVEQWIRKHHSKPETHIKFVDGTEDDYLLEGNVDWQYLVGKGLVQQVDGPPEWIKQPQEVDIGSAVTIIGEYAFNKCSSLTSLMIPNNVTSISYDVFYGCTELTSLIIPDSVAYIGAWTFDGSGLTSVTFSSKTMATVQSMENYSSWGLLSGCVLHCTDGDITI